MKTETKIRPIGGSLGLIIPKLYIDFLEIKEGDNVKLEEIGFTNKKGRYIKIERG